jgi:ZIP family zinc transporter
VIELLGLGAIAGVIPVYMGIVAAVLPGTVLPRSWEGGLIGVATGVLVYLFFDLMHEAVELTSARDLFSWFIFLGSLGVSFVGLVVLEESQLGQHRRLTRALSLPYVIALGMGLHNLGEGLAIGASYAQGQWALSSLLVGGFALHNGTEGVRDYGVGGPDSAQLERHCPLGIARRRTDLLRHGDQRVRRLAIPLDHLLHPGGRLPVIRHPLSDCALIHNRAPAAHRDGHLLGIGLMYTTGMALSLLIGAKA